MKSFVLKLVFFLAGFNIFANEYIDTLIDTAVKNSPELKSMEYSFISKKRGILSSYAFPDPMISFEMMNFPAVSRGMNDPMQEKKISFTQMIPFPGKMISQALVKEKESQIAGAGYTNTLNAIKRDIALMYYKISLTDKKLAVLNDQKKQLEVMQELVRTRYENNRAGADEYIRVKIMKSMADRDIIKMNLDRSVMLQNIIKMAGINKLPDNIKFETGDSIKPPVLDKDKIYDIARAGNTGRIIKNLTALKYKNETYAMAWDLAPDTTFGFSFTLPDNGGAYFSFMAGVTVPLFFYVNQLPGIRSASAMNTMARYDEENENRNLRENITVNIEMINKNAELLELINNNLLKDAKFSLDLALNQYKSEKADFDRILNQIISYNNIYIEKEEMIYQILESYETLKYLTGYKPVDGLTK